MVHEDLKICLVHEPEPPLTRPIIRRLTYWRTLIVCVLGMLMGSYKSVTMPEQLVRLWCHESKRVFEDRLINAEDHAWFKNLLQGIVKNTFQMEWDDVVPQVRVFRRIHGRFHSSNSRGLCSLVGQTMGHTTDPAMVNHLSLIHI